MILFGINWQFHISLYLITFWQSQEAISEEQIVLLIFKLKYLVLCMDHSFFPHPPKLFRLLFSYLFIYLFVCVFVY